MASSTKSNNSFGARGDLQVGGRRLSVYRLDTLADERASTSAASRSP